MKKQSFVYGAIILGISGIVCKVLGAIYKIPLVNVLSPKGVGIYYLVFPVYAFLLTFVSNAFIVSTSKKVSNLVSQGQDRDAHQFFLSTLFSLLFVGTILASLLCFFSKFIANLQGMKEAYICYLAIAPAIIFVAISSSFRGYFQGLQNMSPSAISNIVEQLFKLALGLSLSKIFISKSLLLGAFGAILGVSISELSSCLFFVFYYLYFRKKNKEYFENFGYIQKNKSRYKFFINAKDVFRNAFPFVLSSIILPTSMVIDSFLVVNLLFSMGFDKLFATGLLGLNSGIVGTLVGLPSTFSISLCMTLVPYLVHSFSKKDYLDVSQKASLTIKLNLIISLPCVLVFLFFPKNVLQVLYSGSFGCEGELSLCTTLLFLSSSSVLYLSILQMSTALLQAMNKAYVPVISLLISLVLKVICEAILIRLLGIVGVVLSNCVCYFVSSFINLWQFKKLVPTTASFCKSFLIPIFSCFIMCFAIFLSQKICESFVSFRFASLFSFFVGGVVYLVCIFLFKTFTKEEQASFFVQKSLKKDLK